MKGPMINVQGATKKSVKAVGKMIVEILDTDANDPVLIEALKTLAVLSDTVKSVSISDSVFEGGTYRYRRTRKEMKQRRKGKARK